jgi:hypothetical protein
MDSKSLPKELQDLFIKSGLSEGRWADVEEHSVQPPLVTHQAEALIKLRAFLESLVAQDQATVAQLKEQIVRLKHGGGS